MLLSLGEQLVRSVAVPNKATCTDRFDAEPLALVRIELAARRRGLRLAGYYHSHPNGCLEPSPVDRAAVPWPGLGPRLHLIVAPTGGWRLFAVTADGWVERGAQIEGAGRMQPMQPPPLDGRRAGR